MKKMRNGRRGFTLLEIVIVVAIIVILSAGAFLGVAATVNHASDMQERLEANNGDNFEVHARNQVNSYGKNMVYWDPIPNYTPENQAKKMKEQMLAEGWTDGEITFEYQSDGWHIVAEWDPTLEEHRGFQTPEDYKLWLSNYNNYIALGYTADEIEAGCKNGSTDIKPVWDASKHGGVSEEDYLKQKDKNPTASPQPTDPPEKPTLSPTPTDSPEPTDPPTTPKDPVVDPTEGPSYGNTGRPTTGTTTYASNDTSAATGTSVNIKQKGDQYNNCILSVSVPSDVVSFVVYIPGATNEEFGGYNSNQVTSLGNGYYRITNPNKVTSQEFYSSSFKGSTGAYVVEYTK